MSRALVVTHTESEDPGLIGTWLPEVGLELDVVEPWRGDDLPADLEGYDALVVMGGPQQATKGMQMMNLKLVRLEGGTVDPMLAIVHSVLFWGLNVVLTPLILLATLVLDRKRTVHDLLLGTAVIRSDR